VGDRVDAHGGVDGGDGVVLPERAGSHDAGVVDEHVGCADRFPCGRGGPRDVVEVGDVDPLSVDGRGGVGECAAHVVEGGLVDVPQDDGTRPLGDGASRVD